MERLSFGAMDLDVHEQMTNTVEKTGASRSVLCADNHLGYSMPIGGVIAIKNRISPNCVGFDIACGNKAVRLDACSGEVRQNIKTTMDEMVNCISFGVGRSNKETVEHALFDDPLWQEIPLLTALKPKAQAQLGTVGGGNHYVDIFLDEQDRAWVGVHFGSRGLGHSIATYFLKQGGGKDGIHSDPVVFEDDSDLGEQYLKCMELAGKYAYAGRTWVAQRVATILNAEVLEEVHNHHNFAWKETHDGEEYWVIRKGATPAFPGQRGFVGGSMGDISVILEGVESSRSALALYSTIHGAGRTMGRTEAKGKFHRKTGELLKKGKIKQEDHDAWMAKARVEVRGGALDESPLAYKRIEDVLKVHAGTIKILHTLQPIGVAMAGAHRDGYL